MKRGANVCVIDIQYTMIYEKVGHAKQDGACATSFDTTCRIWLSEDLIAKVSVNLIRPDNGFMSSVSSNDVLGYKRNISSL